MKTAATFNGHPTGTQTQKGVYVLPPQMPVAIKSTIGQQGSDATVIQEGDSTDTARVSKPANMDVLLNIIASGMKIPGIARGKPAMRVLFGAAGNTRGLATPGFIKRLVAFFCDANLFS
jgi:hypothetical protein